MESSDKNRIETLEKELNELKLLVSKGGKKDKKPREKREPTEYNKFIKKYCDEKKQKLGEKYNHKTVFKEAAEEWSKTKK
tara:strand:+ start:1609 stop:1848 length:240 start_codon:yes stop_codon:yes gene_type:complete